MIEVTNAQPSNSASAVFQRTNNKSALIKSGDNYYLRLNPDLDRDSLLLDFGTSEPDFSEN